MSTVVLYVGESLPPNLVRLFSGLVKVLDSQWKLTVVGSGLDSEKLPSAVKYVDIPGEPSSRGISRMFAAYRRMDFYLKKESADAVWQITTPQFHSLPVMIAAKKHGVPFAGRIPGNKFDEYREQSTKIDTVKAFLLNNCQLWLLRYADAVVALEAFNRDRLTDYGISDKKIHILPHPLNTDTFRSIEMDLKRQLKNTLGFDHHKNTVLFVGRLSRLKGMDDLIPVIDALPKAKYEFHFVGTGPYTSQLANRENTVVHGYVEPEDIHQYYKAADLYLHTSHTEVGGISWTMIEAAAVGLPVVARDNGEAATVASYVFSAKGDLLSYLESPSQWKPAPYPKKWTAEALSDKYNYFISDLVESN